MCTLVAVGEHNLLRDNLHVKVDNWEYRVDTLQRIRGEKYKQANYAVRPVEDSINQNFENIVDEIFKEEDEPYLAYRVQEEKRPKPFLNSKGEIEFHNESQTKALLQIHSTRKTTSRPGERYSTRCYKIAMI